MSLVRVASVHCTGVLFMSLTVPVVSVGAEVPFPNIHSVPYGHGNRAFCIITVETPCCAVEPTAHS